MKNNRQEIVASIIAALKNPSRVASSDPNIRKRLIRVASVNQELRPHLLPVILEEGGDRTAYQLLGKSLKLAYESPSKRASILPVIRIAMDKLAQSQGTGGFPAKAFSMWAKAFRRKGKSISPRNLGEEIEMGSLIKSLIKQKKDPLTNPDVQRYWPMYEKCRDEEKCWNRVTKGKRKKGDERMKEKIRENKFKNKADKGKIRSKKKKKEMKKKMEKTQNQDPRSMEQKFVDKLTK